MNFKTLTSKPFALALILCMVAPMLIAACQVSADPIPTGTISAYKAGTTDVSDLTLGPNPNPVGTQVKIDLYISNAADVWGWCTYISWNPDVLQLAGVSNKHWIGDATGDGEMFTGSASGLWDNVHGIVSGGISCVDSDSGTNTASGSGVLAQLTFNVIGIGVSPITVYPNSTLSLNSADLTGTPATVTSATVTATAPLYQIALYQSGTTDSAITIPSTTNPIGATFLLDMYITGSEAVWGYNLNLQWNPTILQLNDISEGSFLNEGTSGTTLFVPGYIDNVSGVVQSGISDVRLSYDSVDGEGVLCTLNFTVIGYGTGVTSPITLTAGNPTLSSEQQPHTALPEPSLLSATYEWTITTPLAPTANFTNSLSSTGSLTTYLQGETITLDATTSTSGLDMLPPYQTCPITNYAWQITLQNGTVLSYPSALTVTFTLPQVSGSIVANLTVTAVDPDAPNTHANYVSTSSLSKTFYVPSTWVGGVLDIYTDKGGKGYANATNQYGPQELVTLFAFVSYNGAPVANKDVQFQICNTHEVCIDIRTATTDTNGLARIIYRPPWSDGVNPESDFGIWSIYSTVDLSQVTLNDTCSFYFNYTVQTLSANITNGASGQLPTFYRMNTTVPVSIDIAFSNVNWDNQEVLYTATIYDNASVPVAFGANWVTITGQNQAFTQNGPDITILPTSAPGVTNGTVTLNLYLKTYSFVGPATVYINAYTQYALGNGIAYCPEVELPLIILNE